MKTRGYVYNCNAPMTHLFLLLFFSASTFTYLQAYIVRRTVLCKNHTSAAHTEIVKIFHDIHYPDPDGANKQMHTLLTQEKSEHTLLESPPTDTYELFITVDSIIEKIILAAPSLLPIDDLNQLNLTSEQQKTARVPLDTLLLSSLGHHLCKPAIDKISSNCIDYRLTILVIQELIELLILLKGHCARHNSTLYYTLNKKLNEHTQGVTLSVDKFFDIISDLFTRSIMICQELVTSLNSLRSRQLIMSFLQELILYREISRNAYSFIKSVNKKNKGSLLNLIHQRIDKYANFFGTEALPILGDKYLSFIKWFSSSSTRLILLDIFVLDKLINKSLFTSQKLRTIIIGASHAEHIISLLTQEGYFIVHDTYYAFYEEFDQNNSQNNKLIRITSLKELFLSNTHITSLERILKPLKMQKSWEPYLAVNSSQTSPLTLL